MITLQAPRPPAVITVMKTAARCPEYWKLAAMLHRTEADNTLEQHVGQMAYRESQIKLDVHFKNCPACNAWWQEITSREPDIIPLEGDET